MPQPRRTKPVSFRLREDEHELVRRAAEAEHESVRGFIRRAIIKAAKVIIRQERQESAA